MKIENLKLRVVTQYNGHSIKNNGDLDLNFKADYSEIVNVVSLVRMLNQTITVKTKVASGKPKDLGAFSLKTLSIDRDGESKIKFNSDFNAINPDTLADLLQPETLITLQCSATVDVEEGDEDE